PPHVHSLIVFPSSFSLSLSLPLLSPPPSPLSSSLSLSPPPSLFSLSLSPLFSLSLSLPPSFRLSLFSLFSLLSLLLPPPPSPPPSLSPSPLSPSLSPLLLPPSQVLLDAPCSNDRSWLLSCGTGGDQQGAVRLRNRARMPTLQTQLLRSALAAVRPGGVVVYSTCTLSRSENQEVVEAVLNTCPGVELQDLEEELALPLQEHFTFTPLGHTPSLGLLVVPQQGQTWGPMFLSRIKRLH
uniref:tRNA (cytosine(34)-C(5))-methyltransferase, mitochondrial-like n=1 Tax=Salmo trutta TaxID=8032 RepID=A0A674AHR2_SALTR